jgi:archaellum component FlaC
MSNNDMTTRPTIETVLDRISTLSVHIDERFNQLDNRFAGVERQMTALDEKIGNLEQQVTDINRRDDALEQTHAAMEKHIKRIDIRLDRIEGTVLTVRSGLDDLRDQLSERIPEIR